MRVGHKRVLRAAIFAALFCLLVVPALADSSARIVRLSYVQGDVQIDRGAGNGLEKAILNMPITEGMLLETGANGRAETEFEDGTVVRLPPASEVGFQQLRLRDSGGKLSTVEVLKGTVYFSVRHKGDDQFKVAFAGRELPVNKPAHFRVEVNQNNTTLAVFSGEVSFKNNGKQVKVHKGEEVALGPNNAVHLANLVSPNAYDDWDKQRFNYHKQYYDTASYSSYPYFGRGDLNYYGAWYRVPGYGRLWQPYNAGFDFDPFNNGCWTWYPGFGYTFVSGYPWGWLPYRYGSWVFVPGWGWGWMPAYWNNWVVVPRVINPPAGYIVPTRPSASNPQQPTIAVNPRPGVIVAPRAGIVTNGATPATPKTGIIPAKPASPPAVYPVPPPTGIRPPGGTRSPIVAPARPPSAHRTPAEAAGPKLAPPPPMAQPFRPAAPRPGFPQSAPLAPSQRMSAPRVSGPATFHEQEGRGLSGHPH
jgi:hypothetical protein